MGGGRRRAEGKVEADVLKPAAWGSGSMEGSGILSQTFASALVVQSLDQALIL